jgi:tetratricopeptide (TPR) repeat protein
VLENAATALKLDPGLSQPHAAIAFVHERNFRWEESEKELEKAIALNPNNVTARHWNELNISLLEKNEAAISEWRKAKELDPLSLIVGANLGLILVKTGHNEEGISMLKAVLELDDAFVVGHRALALAYLSTGMNVEAVEEAKKLVSLEESEANLADLAIFCAMAGFSKESIPILDKLLKASETRYVEPVAIAAIYSALGDEANALKWSERGIKEKSAGAAYLKTFPPFDRLRNNLKFIELLKQVGLA